MRKGFTLIEITIVIIIMGTMATLALPRITGQLDVARGAEALVYMWMLKNQSLNCYESHETMARCDDPVKLGVQPPNSPRHTYSYASIGVDEFHVMAVSNYVPTNCLKMSVLGSTGKVGLTGYGFLSNVISRASQYPANGAGADCTAY